MTTMIIVLLCILATAALAAGTVMLVMEIEDRAYRRETEDREEQR